jgi:hypothetical protein
MKKISYQYKPIFVKPNDTEILNELKEDRSINIIDTIDSQLKELIKSKYPSKQISKEEFPHLIHEFINQTSIENYGTWVYYPWSKKLIHILNEKEFVHLRTNRNMHKISPEEMDVLATKKIGIIGLSVGHSIALTIATERICKEIRLADFDTLELSNLNRIRTGIHNLGLPKVVIAAREIAEIDPYINVKIYDEGVNQNNIEDFFEGEGKLDIVVEVCDSLEVKILTRLHARQKQIAVVMDTNDRGMLDVERFDIEIDRPIFHGLIKEDELIDIESKNANERLPILMKIVSFENCSDRLKYSLTQIGKTITSFPQLASAVVLGGAITTDIVRRILLKQHQSSGRFYIDLEKLIF